MQNTPIAPGYDRPDFLKAGAAIPATSFLGLLHSAGAQGTGPNRIQTENALTGSDPYQLPDLSDPNFKKPWGIESAYSVPGNYGFRWDYASKYEIEGFTDQTSVQAGQSFKLYVNCAPIINGQATPYFKIYIYRLGWYGGKGSRQVYVSDWQQPIAQSTRYAVNATSGLVNCDSWTLPIVLSTSTSWASGLYMIILETATGPGMIWSDRKFAQIPLIVRDESGYPTGSDRAILVQFPITTTQAYNVWPGAYNWAHAYNYDIGSWMVHKGPYIPTYSPIPSPDQSPELSIYFRPEMYSDVNNGASGQGAVKVSFNRPYDPYCSNTFFHFAYNFVRFVERLGLNVTYCSSLDLETAPGTLPPVLQNRNRSGFVSVGHDEYWSLNMRSSIDAALKDGMHLAFLGGNPMYWQIRYETDDGLSSPETWRTIACFKQRESGWPVGLIPIHEDPNLGMTSDPLAMRKTTGLWRSSYVQAPEDAIVGIGWINGASDVLKNFVVQNAENWLFSNAQVTDGAVLCNLVGYEADGVITDGVLGVAFPSPYDSLDVSSKTNDEEILATSDSVVAGTAYSQMTVYAGPYPSRNYATSAMVWATGSMYFNWGLDDYKGNWQFTRYVTIPDDAKVVSSVAQQMVYNFVNVALNGQSIPLPIPLPS